MAGEGDRLRAGIDAGKTRDKVPFPDPAAAPLGTDDEAAGARPAADEAPPLRGQEFNPEPPSEEDHRAPPRKHPTAAMWTTVFGVLVGVLVAMATVSWLADR